MSAPNLSKCCVKIRPSVDMERRFASNTCAGDAGVVILCLKSLGMYRLKVMSSRDLLVDIMVCN